MKFSSATATGLPSGFRDAAAVLAAHADWLGSVDVAGLDEDTAIDLVRSNEKAARLLAGVSVLVGARLDELGGLGAADVFSTAGRFSDGAARSLERRSELLGTMPVVGAGCVTGAITGENTDAVAIARHKLRHHDRWQAAFDERDASIARRAARLRPRPFRAWLGALVAQISDDGETDAASNRAMNKMALWKTRDGRWRGRFDLDSVSGEQLNNAINAQARSIVTQNTGEGSGVGGDGDGVVRHGEHTNARALSDLVAGGHSSRGRASIQVIVDAETLRTGLWDGTTKRTGDGADLPLSDLRRLLCDAWITHTVMGPRGRALAVGRSYRTATDAQRAALRVMYPTCACCDTVFDRCEIHHIIEWENGGLTNLDNLIPLCSTHHDRMHTSGWSITMDPNRTLTIRRPDNTIWQTRPLPAAQPAQQRHQTRQAQQRHQTRTDSNTVRTGGSGGVSGVPPGPNRKPGTNA